MIGAFFFNKLPSCLFRFLIFVHHCSALAAMASFTSSTIQAASYTRIRHIQQSRAPIPAAQRKEKAAEREKVQEAIDTAVSEWFSASMATANQLAERFDKKPRYFLDIFFHGGARMIKHHEKPNAHNAFLSMKSQELRDGKSWLYL
jgi:hypothetical protein